MAKKTSARLDRDIAESVAKVTTKKKAAPRIAYHLKLTPSEVLALDFARGRYQWPDRLLSELLEDGTVAFTEAQMWSWCDDVDSDAEGGHSPFPLASPKFADKLQSFYDERV